MALIICTECGKQFSDKAAACPNCGCPTEYVIQSLNIPVGEGENVNERKESTGIELLTELNKLKTLLNTEKQLQERKKIIKDNFAVANFNMNKQQISADQEEFLKREDAFADDALERIRDWKKDFDAIYPVRYHDRIDDVIHIIEGMRADTVKDALNIMMLDDQATENKNLLEEHLRITAEQNAEIKDQLEEQRRITNERNAEQRKWEAEQRKKEETITMYCRICKRRYECNHYGETYGFCYR